MSRLGTSILLPVLMAATFLATEWAHYRLGTPPIFELLLGSGGGSNLTAGTSGHDSSDITESEFQTYLRVLEAMQTDQSLSIEKAVATERIALEKFRDLERRVQRNDGMIDRARHILREKAENLWNARYAPMEHG